MMEKNQDSAGQKLWCVNVHGPDDVYPMPDRLFALERANELNVAFSRMQFGRDPASEFDPIMRAVVIEWPHSAEMHAESVSALGASLTIGPEPVAEVIECPVNGQQTVAEIDGRWRWLSIGTKLYAEPDAALPLVQADALAIVRDALEGADVALTSRNFRPDSLARSNIAKALAALHLAAERASLTDLDPLKYAQELAVSIRRKHYPEAPNFKPLDDLWGVISQLDNMSTGMTRASLTDEPSDELVHQLTGYRPEQMSSADASVMRVRAAKRRAELLACASAPAGAQAVPVAMFMRGTTGSPWITSANFNDSDAVERFIALKSGDLLYAAPVVQPVLDVARKLPPRKVVPELPTAADQNEFREQALAEGWNACLDAIASGQADGARGDEPTPKVREALIQLERAVDLYLGRSAWTQTKSLKGIGYSDQVREGLYAAHDEARAALAATTRCRACQADGGSST